VSGASSIFEPCRVERRMHVRRLAFCRGPHRRGFASFTTRTETTRLEQSPVTDRSLSAVG
jgi:hypothetical protein